MFSSLSIICASAVCSTNAFVFADRAIQHLNQRAVYQGGWPLSLSASNTTCPAEAPVKCSNGNVNPGCCPTGQFCHWGSGVFAFSCCPTADSCEVAVRNFPRCANATWNMFSQGSSSYFCCEPGLLGVNPITGLPDGLCEAADQPIPATLLATKAAQIGAPTSTPTSSGNTTQVAGGPNQTNPAASPSSTSSKSGSGSGNDLGTVISRWSTGTKIGVGIAVVAAVVVFLVVVSVARRRRRNRMGYQYATGYGQYDEYGNLIQQSNTGYRPGYEPYRRQNEGVANNVTVNVVRGDQTT